jgi:hypothetical protein
MHSKDLKEVICFLPILVLAALKLFVFPALFVCMLAFFFFASAWTDAAAVPYLQFFFFAGPIVWFAGTVYLIFRFTHPISRPKRTSSYE